MVGQKIKKIRLFKNFTQEHMAERLGVSVKTWNKIETGAAPVSVERLDKIAQELGVKSEDILNLKDDGTVFNNSSFNEAQRDIVINNQVFAAEKEAYEARIHALEESIEILKGSIKTLEGTDRFQKSLIDKLMSEKA